MRPTLRGRQIVLRHLIAVVPALAGLLVVAGCYRRVSYVSPEGRKVEIVNIGFDTRIGSLHAQTESGSLRIENAESQALLSQRLAELAAALADGGK